MEKLKNIPSLRFPEFEGEWKFEPLENYIELFSGIALKGHEITDDNSGTPILRGINITEGFIRHTNEIDKFYLGNTSKLEKYFVKENDIVLGMDGSKVGKNVALIKKEDENSILIQRVARIRNNEKSDIKYIYQQIFSKKFRDYVDIVNTSSGIPHISSQQIKDFKVGFCSLQEQTKIASFLTAVDDKLQALKQKKTLLEQYKKGVMQKIFSQELRFKDDNGNEFSDWEEKRLGNICNVKGRIGYRGYTVKDIVNQGEGAVTLSPSNIKDGKLSLENSTYISWDKYNESPEIMLEENDVILVKTASVGKSAFVKNLIEPATINPQFVVLKNIKINPEYFAFVVYSPIIQKQIVATVGLGAVPNLSQESISNFILPIPSMNEQTKIANFLSTIDDKINHCQAQIEKMELWKKGLLQQMFV